MSRASSSNVARPPITRHALQSVYVRSVDDAVAVVRAVLHTIVFVRALGLCVPADDSVVVRGEEIMFARCNDKHVEHRVERACTLLRRALALVDDGDAVDPAQLACASLAQIETEFGQFSRQELAQRQQAGAPQHTQRRRLHRSTDSGARRSTVQSWASWLTSSLSASPRTLQPSPLARFSMASDKDDDAYDYHYNDRADGHDCEDALLQHSSMLDERFLMHNRARVWETWTFRVYVVGESFQRSKLVNVRDVLAHVLLKANENRARLPPLRGTLLISYPFRMHVRVPTADDDADLRRPVSTRAIDIATSHRAGSASSSSIGRSNSSSSSVSSATNRHRMHSAATSSSVPVDASASVGQAGSPPVRWWNSLRLSPGSGTWEHGIDLLRDLVANAPMSSSGSGSGGGGGAGQTWS